MYMNIKGTRKPMKAHHHFVKYFINQMKALSDGSTTMLSYHYQQFVLEKPLIPYIFRGRFGIMFHTSPKERSCKGVNQ